MPFPVEKAPIRKILARKGLGGAGVIVSELLNYPVRGFAFEGGNGSTVRALSDAVVNSCISLQNKNIPFNILIAQCGKKIFLFPQVNTFSKFVYCCYIKSRRLSLRFTCTVMEFVRLCC